MRQVKPINTHKYKDMETSWRDVSGPFHIFMTFLEFLFVTLYLFVTPQKKTYELISYWVWKLLKLPFSTQLVTEVLQL